MTKKTRSIVKCGVAEILRTQAIRFGLLLGLLVFAAVWLIDACYNHQVIAIPVAFIFVVRISIFAFTEFRFGEIMQSFNLHQFQILEKLEIGKLPIRERCGDYVWVFFSGFAFIVSAHLRINVIGADRDIIDLNRWQNGLGSVCFFIMSIAHISRNAIIDSFLSDHARLDMSRIYKLDAVSELE